MRRIEEGLLLAVVVALCWPAGAGAAAAEAKVTRPTAAQIVKEHLAARGGLKAWQGVASASWSGKLDVGAGDSQERSARLVQGGRHRKGRSGGAESAEQKPSGQQVQVPFVLEMKRPGKSRLEIEFAGRKAVQVFDGQSGWLLRPYLNRDDWEPFNAEQAKASKETWALGSPLLDASAPGTKVALVAVEQIDGRDAYKLEISRKGRGTQHVWIDAKTWLDVKVEGVPRRLDGKLHAVWVTQRDFRPVDGLLVPYELETAVDGTEGTHRMLVDRVALNPPLADARFARPRT